MDIGGTPSSSPTCWRTGCAARRSARNRTTSPETSPASSSTPPDTGLERVGCPPQVGRPRRPRPRLGRRTPHRLDARPTRRLDSRIDWTAHLQSPVPVPVLNDAHAALLGEAWTGAAAGCRNAVLLTLGTGVGGAAIVRRPAAPRPPRPGRASRAHLPRPRRPAGHRRHARQPRRRDRRMHRRAAQRRAVRHHARPRRRRRRAATQARASGCDASASSPAASCRSSTSSIPKSSSSAAASPRPGDASSSRSRMSSTRWNGGRTAERVRIVPAPLWRVRRRDRRRRGTRDSRPMTVKAAMNPATTPSSTMTPAADYLDSAAACIDAVERPAAADPPGRRLVRRDHPRRAHGPRLRLGPQPDHGRGDVAAVRLVPRLQPDRRTLADVSQPRRRRQRPAAGDVPRKRQRPGRANPPQLRSLARGLGPGHLLQRLQRRADRDGRAVSRSRGVQGGRDHQPAALRSEPEQAIRAGKKLQDFADLVLDTGAPLGDAMVQIDGLDTPVSPGSTVGGCLLVNAIKAEVARATDGSRAPPKVLSGARGRRARSGRSSCSNPRTTSTPVGWRSSTYTSGRNREGRPPARPSKRLPGPLTRRSLQGPPSLSAVRSSIASECSARPPRTRRG